MSVQYKMIDGFPTYKVGDNGTVLSFRKNKWRQLFGMRGTGYATIRFYVDGKRKDIPIHKLVLNAFVGPCPEGMEACHHDDDSFNNALSNLRWDTHKANAYDSIRNGSFAFPKALRGSSSSRSKLSEFDVAMIRALLKEGCLVKELALDFRVGPSQIKRISKGTTWRHLW